MLTFQDNVSPGKLGAVLLMKKYKDRTKERRMVSQCIDTFLGQDT
jgi:hypothetical protein